MKNKALSVLIIVILVLYVVFSLLKLLCSALAKLSEGISSLSLMALVALERFLDSPTDSQIRYDLNSIDDVALESVEMPMAIAPLPEDKLITQHSTCEESDSSQTRSEMKWRSLPSTNITGKTQNWMKKSKSIRSVV